MVSPACTPQTYIGRMHALQGLVHVAAMGERWLPASEIAMGLTDEVDGLDAARGDDDAFMAIGPIFVETAGLLDHGGETTRPQMVKMLRKAAARYAALGNAQMACLVWRKLINSRRVSWGNPSDLKPPDNTEAAAMVDDVESLFAELRKLDDRSDDDVDVCSICQGQLSSTEPVDVLECLHVFHGQCVRSIFDSDRTEVSHESRTVHADEQFILTSRCPLCRTEVSMSGKRGAEMFLSMENSDAVREVPYPEDQEPESDSDRVSDYG